MEVDNIETKAVSSTEKTDAGKSTVAFRPQDRALHDANVTLEEYMYYASKTRAEEDANSAQAPTTTLWDVLFPSRGKTKLATGAQDADEDSVGEIYEMNLNRPENRAAVSDKDWTNASRALRSASAAAAFYLISTSSLPISRLFVTQVSLLLAVAYVEQRLCSATHP
jgi:hypothetical protein